MNSEKVVIKVNDVSKRFKIYFDKKVSLKEKIISLATFKKQQLYHEYWAIRNVNLDIIRGKTVGLIGKNGSGKSTLLKLLTKIIYPTNGDIKIDGKVSSLLELGAGFHPDFTGYENIYNNAAIFGLTKKEIDQRLEEIIRFSELGEFINNPVRTYSSGMYARLAFSVAINVDADILLVDEVLAVGDLNFQQKCFQKIDEIKANNVTIVIVSHDLETVKNICDYTVWINDGVIADQGDTLKVVNSYLEYMEKAGEY